MKREAIKVCHGLQKYVKEKYVKEKWKILGNSRVKMIMS